MSDEQAGALASEAAAKIVTTFGARLENDDLQTILKKISH